jgi:outer membrane protein
VRMKNFLAAAAILLVLAGVETNGAFAQAAPAPDAAQPAAPAPDAAQTATPNAPVPDATAQHVNNGAVQIPLPVYTQPLFLRDTNKDYTHAHSPIPIPIAQYAPTNYDLPRLTNTPRLDQLLRDGKIYLSLADAVTLALENNFDIAIARINLDIADTDLLRARAGSTLRGVNTGLVTGTLGGTTDTVTTGGGPGGTSTASGGAGSGTSGLVESTNGGGPLPEAFDPYVTGKI